MLDSLERGMFYGTSGLPQFLRAPLISLCFGFLGALKAGFVVLLASILIIPIGFDYYDSGAAFSEVFIVQSILVFIASVFCFRRGAVQISTFVIKRVYRMKDRDWSAIGAGWLRWCDAVFLIYGVLTVATLGSTHLFLPGGANGSQAFDDTLARLLPGMAVLLVPMIIVFPLLAPRAQRHLTVDADEFEREPWHLVPQIFGLLAPQLLLIGVLASALQSYLIVTFGIGTAPAVPVAAMAWCMAWASSCATIAIVMKRESLRDSGMFFAS